MVFMLLIGSVFSSAALPRHGLLIIPEQPLSFSEFPRVNAPSCSCDRRPHGRMKHFVVHDEGDEVTWYGFPVEHGIDPDGVRPLAVAAQSSFSDRVARA